MKVSQIIVLSLVAVLSLLGGGLYSHFYQAKAPQSEASEKKDFCILEEGIITDAFSLKLFKQVISENEGNVLTAPHAISDALYALSQLTGGISLEEMKSLQLRKPTSSPAVNSLHNVILAADISIPRKETGTGIMAIPFSENTPLALSIFNGLLAQTGPDMNARYAKTDNVSERTRLLAGAVAYCCGTWEIPFRKEDSRMAEFDSKSGAMPSFHQMRSRGNYRTARAGDGTWRAAAMLMQPHEKTPNPRVLIGIIPSGSARAFAESLTPDLLSHIRKSLAEATPEDTLVEFPRLELEVRPFDMRYILRKLGLTSIFDTEKADFSGLTNEKIHLNGMIHASALRLVETDTKSPASPELDYAKNHISFSRPFIWLIGDLTSDTPFEFMGLVEEM